MGNPNFVPADLPRGDGMPSAQFKTDLRDGQPGHWVPGLIGNDDMGGDPGFGIVQPGYHGLFSDGDTMDEDMPPVGSFDDDFSMDEEGVGQPGGASYIVIWDHEE